MSEIKILVDIGGSASSLKDVINDLEKLRDVSEEIRAKKGKLIEAKGSEDIAKLTAEIESLRAKYEKLTAEKVKAKQGASDLDKAINKLNKAQSDEGKELAKVNQQIKETNQLNKIQSGILGDLLKRRKQLQEGLVTAKTTDEVKKINQELFRTNLEIGKIKQDGVKAFNSWGNALSSFQFKFNALGSVIGNTIGGILSGGITGLITGIGTLITKTELWKSVTETVSEAYDDLTDALGFTSIAYAKVEVKRLEDLSKGAKKLTAEEEQRLKVLEALGEKTIENEIAAKEAENARLEDLKFHQDIGRSNLKFSKEQRDEQQKALVETVKQIKDNEDAIEILKAEARKRDRDAIGEFIADIQDVNEEAHEKNKDLAKKASENKAKLAQEDADRVRSAIEQERKYEIEAIIGKFGEAEQIINKQSIETKIAWGTVLPDELQAYNEQIRKEKEDARKKELDDTKKIIDEKKQINDEFIEYEIDALDGSFGEAERIISRQELATKIALRTATIPEIKAWNELLKKEADKASADKKKRLEEEFEVAERFANAAFEGMEERNARDLKMNADKLTELDRQAQFQRELALKGEINTFQEVEKARAEALAEKAAMEKKAANIAKGEKAAEIFLEFYKAYAQEAAKQGNEALAFSKALKATATGQAGSEVVKALFSGSFYEGTEDTGGPGNLDGKGGKGAIIHPHERILTRAHNEAIGLDVSNEEVVRRVNLFEDMPVADKRIDVQVNESLNKMLLNELKEINKAVKNPAYIDIQRNYINELVSIERRLGAQIETTHKRIGTSYSRD